MELLADGLLIAGALCAALYCWVLSRRVNALKSLESGLGSAIAALSRQVEETRRSLSAAKQETTRAAQDLSEITARAEIAAGRLELLMAAVHRRGEGGATPIRSEPRAEVTAADDAAAPQEAQAEEGSGEVPASRRSAVEDRAALIKALRGITRSVAS